MNRRIFLVILVEICLILWGLAIPFAKSQNEQFSFILINKDGSVEPSSAPIQRADNIYSFTSDIDKPIVVERDNITLYGAGHRLQRIGTFPNIMSVDSGVGINLTSNYVTARNIYISNWNTGILGVYGNNEIINNSITGCYNGISVYGNNYNIEWNYIANNQFKGINLRANHTSISCNEIAGEQDGINISYSDHVIRENNMSNVGYDITGTGISGVAIYRNNFFKTNPNRYLFAGSGTATWDNGKEGNFWSRYNGTDANGDGIGDTPYSIGQFFVYTTLDGKNVYDSRIWGVDYLPLMNPVAAQESPPLQPTLKSTSTQTLPGSTPSPNLTQLPSPAVSLNSSSTLLPAAPPTLSPSPTIPEFPMFTIPILILVAALTIVITNQIKTKVNPTLENPFSKQRRGDAGDIST